MTDLHQDIKGWLHKQQDWLQQAADLLLTKGTLDDNDIGALTKSLKTANGQAITNTRPFVELASGVAQSSEVRLKSIGEISGIENLGSQNSLDFEKGNLCVIYGNNGSGKSGYTRLLKKAAGKPLAKDLKHNVFQQVPALDKRKAKITFIADGDEHSTDWIANDSPLLPIQVIDIFDTDIANNYLSKDNEATYTPPLVSLFEKLVIAVNRAKDRLLVQQATLQKVLPALPPQFEQTASGIQYNGLKANSNATVVQKIQTWTDSEERLLAQFNERLAATDPQSLARQKRANKTQIEQIANQIKAAVVAYTDDALAAIRVNQQEADAKRKVAQEAALITSSKLDGVGTETWKLLWEAAKNYSQIAYPQKEFPVIDQARCVLCHQDIALEAKQRLQDFEQFVQGEIEEAAKIAEKAYKSALTQLPVALTEDVLTERCQAAGLNDELLVQGIKAFWKSIAKSREAIQFQELVEDAHAVPAPQSILETLDTQAKELDEQAKQLELDATEFNRDVATKDKVELDAKKWTSQQSAAITAEITRLKSWSEYDGWIKSTSTQQITVKGGLVAEAAITVAYVERFNKELKALRADRIKVKLVKTKSVKGKAFHALQLEGVLYGNTKLDEVLSEGERRIISLAAFLADVAEKPYASTFIFDDPISSLDQDFEIAVSNRLVELAKTRQVLVFTHRLSLYGHLEDAAKKMGKEWHKQHHLVRCIETYGNVSGLPVSPPIWAGNTNTANQDLLTRLATAQKVGVDQGSDAYRTLAQSICSDFRKLIERTIESDLLNGIVIRQRRGVQTDNKLVRLKAIIPDDIKYIDGLMSKFSGFEHSQSQENPLQVPEVAELKADLEELQRWRKGLSERKVSGVADVP